MFDSTPWVKPEAWPSLPPGEVHLWLGGLDTLAPNFERAFALLTPDEQSRAIKFRLPLLRDRFVAGRAALRHILAQYVGIPPAKVAFDYNTHGKPRLRPGRDKGAPLAFNCSHSEDCFVCAVTLDGDIGVDVESIKRSRPCTEIAERFFHSEEAAWLRALPHTEQADEFYAIWTAKEAYMKALGKGMSLSLNSFSTIGARDRPPEIWRFKTLSSGDFVGACATSTPGDLTWRHWCLATIDL